MTVKGRRWWRWLAYRYFSLHCWLISGPEVSRRRQHFSVRMPEATSESGAVG